MCPFPDGEKRKESYTSIRKAVVWPKVHVNLAKHGYCR